MEKIPSFTIDHERLLRGIYVSRRDVTPSGDVITTFDIRMTEPNREPAISPQALHAIEHIVATYVRNHPLWGRHVVYWGPMGCCTGNYLILQGDLSPHDIWNLVSSAFLAVIKCDGEIPGATAHDCGNYTFMDLEGAKKAATKFFDEVLTDPKDENFHYPE